MTEPFQSIIEYELYIYSLKDIYSEIQESNLVLILKCVLIYKIKFVKMDNNT